MFMLPKLMELSKIELTGEWSTSKLESAQNSPHFTSK